ncbi:MAG: radical SAM protein [Spirochaetales bacterium]|nr:radical SAM protein [Spirochaetales bacterium]
MKKERLLWIDSFIDNVREHLLLREEDDVLIIPPNRVYKVNESGRKLLRFLLDGGRIGDVTDITDGERTEQVHWFFCDLRAFFSGCPEAPEARRAVERINFSFDFTRLPVLGEIAVTYRCNNRCLFCYAGCGGRKKGKELGTRRIERIIGIFKEKAKIPFFSFTGGEPLLRDDLEHLVRYAVARGLRVNLITNATLFTTRRARALFRAGLRTAQVSVESHDEEVHDRLTGNPGSYRKTLAGIEMLQEAGISVQTNTTLNGINAFGIEHLPAFLSALCIKRFSLNLFIPSGRGLEYNQLFFPYSAAGPVIETMQKEARKHGLVFYWYSPVPHCLFNPIAHGLGNKSCAAMDGLISVSPEGDVLPCSSYPEPMGNLLLEEFEAVWFSKRAAFFKNKLFALRECEGCSMFTACQSACPLYFQYAGADEIKAGRASLEKRKRVLVEERS